MLPGSEEANELQSAEAEVLFLKNINGMKLRIILIKQYYLKLLNLGKSYSITNIKLCATDEGKLKKK